MNQYTVLLGGGVKTDFNNWNSMANHYGTKTYTPKRQPAKKLVAAVIREFEQWCKDWHVDATAYKFIEPCEIEGEWCQFDFMDSDTEKWPAKVMIHSIIANKNYAIMQRVIDI